MARTMIDHACESCGAIRKVSPDKIAKGKQRVCRKCQGPAAAEKRKVAMIKRGGPKPVTYAYCKECRSIYPMATIDDDGICSDVCRERASKRGFCMDEMRSRALNRLWRKPPADKRRPRKKKSCIPPHQHPPTADKKSAQTKSMTSLPMGT